jgi:hypothetical protein
VLELFEIVTRYEDAALIPAESPLQWGSEEHVRELFGDRVASLSLERRCFQPNPLADLDLLKTHHPLLVTLYRDLADQPDRAAALDRELAETVGLWQTAGQQLLLIVARKRLSPT